MWFLCQFSFVYYKVDNQTYNAYIKGIIFLST